MKTNTGATLIIVIGVLVLLMLMGVVFGTLTRIEREVSQRYIDQFRAKLLAQSGLEWTISELATRSPYELARHPKADWLYWGEDINQNNRFDPGEDRNGNGELDTIECPLSRALRPSFARLDERGRPKSKKIREWDCGYSGTVGGTYEPGGDIYVLKVIDCSGQIYINGGGKGTKQLLNNLGDLLGVGDNLGQRITNARGTRPGKRFTVKEELKTILNKEDYNKIASCVTLYGVSNPKVIQPKRLDQRPHQPLKIGDDIFTWAKLNPGKISLEPRVPINVNTAPKPVLMAVLARLEGFYLHQSEVKSGEISGGLNQPGRVFKDSEMRLGILKRARIESDEPEQGGFKMAEAIAREIIKARAKRPFLTWTEFHTFCDRLVEKGILGRTRTPRERELARARADVIKANANPNTLLNDFNPDFVAYRSVDKSDLTVYTTEFCFQPQGYFKIESLGMITKTVSLPQARAIPGLSPSPPTPQTLVLAEHHIRTVVKLFEIYTDTVQQDFLRGTISHSEELAPTHGSMTCQTYPEPDISNYARQCIADGQIALATYESQESDTKRLTFRHHFAKGLRADYAAGNPYPVEETEKTDSQGLPAGESLGRPNAKSLFHTGFGGSGSLYPDGVYSEINSCPTYHAGNNFPDAFLHEELFGTRRFRGTISFWVKPNYLPLSTKPRVLFSATKRLNSRPHPQYRHQVQQNVFELFLFPPGYPRTDLVGGQLRAEPRGNLIWFWEIDHTRGNEPDEYIFTNSSLQPEQKMPMSESTTFPRRDHSVAWPEMSNHHKWFHIGIAWDTNPEESGIGSGECTRCEGRGKIVWNEIDILCRRCNGKGRMFKRETNQREIFAFLLNGSDAYTRSIYNQPDQYPPNISNYLEFSKDNLIRFGERSTARLWNSSGDFTVDEVTIQLHDDIQAAREFFLSEYKQGRYYRGEAEFTSEMIEVPLDIGLSGKSTKADESPSDLPAQTGIPPKETEVFPALKIKASVAWTVYYPENWPVRERNVEVQFFNEADEPISPPLSESRGSGFEIPVESRARDKSVGIKYKVFFRTDPKDLNTPLLETPIFDDITITFTRPKVKRMEWYVIP